MQNSTFTRKYRYNERRAPNIAIVGGGAGGVELAFAMQQRIREEAELSASSASLSSSGAAEGSVTIFTKGFLTQHNENFQQRIRSLLGRKGVKLVEDAEVAEVQNKSLILADGRRYEFDECLWCTQVSLFKLHFETS